MTAARHGVSDNGPVSERHPMLTYTLLRFLLFVVPFLLLTVVGADVLVALVVAAFISAIVSVFLLSRQRDAVSTAITTRTERAKAKAAERAAAEDAWDDAQRAQPAGDTEPDQSREQGTESS